VLKAELPAFYGAVLRAERHARPSANGCTRIWTRAYDGGPLQKEIRRSVRPDHCRMCFMARLVGAVLKLSAPETRGFWQIPVLWEG